MIKRANMKIIFRDVSILLLLLVTLSHFSCVRKENIIEINENEINRLKDVANNYSKFDFEENEKSIEENKETIFLEVENKKSWKSKDKWIIIFYIPVKIENLKANRILSLN